MIEIIEINDWREILDLEIEFSHEIFRGQSDASWPLSSSLERLVRGTAWEEDIPNTEFWFLREFKQKARLYLNDLPEKNDFISWLSIMQHHGTPTRLIDFSHSFYVACYFSLINSLTDSAVWAIDPDLLLDISHKIFHIKRKGLRDEWEDNIYRETNSYLSSLFSTAANDSGVTTQRGATYVEPFHGHQRFAAQQGIFVVPFDIHISLENNLKSFINSEITKIVIKHKVKETGLAHLRAMNITSETLFPGIDGFAKSIVHKRLCM